MRILFFFFQAEDGIRDIGVTGVQTCALPIYPKEGRLGRGDRRGGPAQGRRRGRRPERARRLSGAFCAGEDIDVWPRKTSVSGSKGIGSTTNTTRRSARDRKSTRLNSSHANISYAVFCL